MQITIFEENGFKKQVQIDKAVIRIGSSPASDIQLRASHISPFHLQILYARETPDRCKVLNLATEAATLLSNGQEKSLAAYNTAEILSEDELQLNGFRLRFGLPLTSGTLSTSHKISASIALPEPVLRPKATLLGRISLKNEGENNSCQFHIEVNGFPEECFQIDPVPLIYAGGQEDVNIRFFHRQTYPQAGFQSVTICVTAPDSYPGEQVSLQQGIYVTPILEQALVVHDDMPESQPVANMAEAAFASPVSATPGMIDASQQPSDKPVVVEAAHPEPVPAPAASVTETTVENPVPAMTENKPQEKPLATPARPLPSKAKVVRTPAESFWDE